MHVGYYNHFKQYQPNISTAISHDLSNSESTTGDNLDSSGQNDVDNSFESGFSDEKVYSCVHMC